MSSKTRTRKPRTTTNMTGSTRTPRSVADQSTAEKARTDTEDKLWQALHANPNSTTADLASAATIGKSTAGKVLAKWEKDSSVTRTPGIAEGGRRAADLWAIPDGDTEPAATTASPHDAQADPDTPDPSDAQPVGGDSAESMKSAADDAKDDTDAEETTSAPAEPVAKATKPAPADTADGDTEQPARLAPGALRGMVEDFLRTNPGEEFGPTAIANALGGKSSGAVSNALDKLVETKTAVRTKESPRRFALTPAEADAAP